MNTPKIKITVRDFGEMTAELYPEMAPLTVANFVKLAKEDFFAEALHTFWVAQCGAHVLSKNYPEYVGLNYLTV